MTMDDNDIFESLGGSLLNDLLADLNAAAASQRRQQQHSNNFHINTIDDNTDDLFALLEQELISTYKDPPPCPSHDSSHAAAASASSSGGPMLPGRNHVSAAMVVNQQHAINSSHNIGHAENNVEEDVWSNSLSQFGNMSLAADFLAADSAKKQQTLQQKTKQRENQFDESLLFEQQGDYLLEEDVVYGNTAITTLLGGTPSTTTTTTTTKGHPTSSTETANASSGAAETAQMPRPTPPPPSHPPAAHTVMVPPPSHMTGFLMPAPPPPSAVLPPPQPMILNQMLLPPMLPVTGISGMAASSGGGGGGAGPIPFDADNFPALGSTPEERRNPNTTPTMASAATMAARPEIIILNNNIINNNNNNNIAATKAQIIFNNTNPHTPPISAHLIQSKLMPFRDTCFIVNVMMRTLKCLDAYNDDYYHWSVLHRRTKNISHNHPLHHHQRLLAGMPPGVVMAAATPAIIPLQPTPLSRGIKETVKGQEEAFQKAVKERAKTFAEEQKSLGQLVKTNVKRPKALLDTPVLKKEEDAEGGKTATASSIPDDKYEAGRQVGRIRLWKARVTIDGGYAAFLSLMELRRLIQAQVRGDPRVIQDLMVDVKSNIDLLHSSLGVSVQVNSEGSKTIEIDERRLGTTLSLSKGRILCARSIEEGIVPHPTACNLLPAALRAIFSEPMPSEGEDRLLRAFTGLILTENPGVHPEILCSCLEVATSFAARGDTDDKGVASSGSGSNLTSSHTRMNLMHGLLSMGKHVCAGSPLNKDWLEREQVFRDMLNLA